MYYPTYCRCALFAVIAAAPAFVVERRTALQEMLNGAYGGHMFCFGEHLHTLTHSLAQSHTTAQFESATSTWNCDCCYDFTVCSMRNVVTVHMFCPAIHNNSAILCKPAVHSGDIYSVPGYLSLFYWPQQLL
jgi:hypothetical protein